MRLSLYRSIVETISEGARCQGVANAHRANGRVLTLPGSCGASYPCRATSGAIDEIRSTAIWVTAGTLHGIVPEGQC